MNNNTQQRGFAVPMGVIEAEQGATWFYLAGGPHGWLACSAEAAATWHLAGVPVRLSHFRP